MIPEIPEAPIRIWEFSKAPARYLSVIKEYLPEEFGRGSDERALLAFVKGGYLGEFHPIAGGFQHRCITLAGSEDNAVIVVLW